MITIEAILVDILNFIKRYFETFFATIVDKSKIINSITNLRPSKEYMNPHVFFILSLSFVGFISEMLNIFIDNIDLNQLYEKYLVQEVGRNLITSLPFIISAYIILWIAAIKIHRRRLFIHLVLYTAGVWYLIFCTINSVIQIIFLFGFNKSWNELMVYIYVVELFLIVFFSFWGVPRNLERRILTFPIVVIVTFLMFYQIQRLIVYNEKRKSINHELLNFETFSANQLQINVAQVNDSLKCSIKIIIRNLSDKTYLLGSVKGATLFFDENRDSKYIGIIGFKRTDTFDKIAIVIPHQMASITLERVLSNKDYLAVINKIAQLNSQNSSLSPLPPSYLGIELKNEFMSTVYLNQHFKRIEIIHN